MIPKDIVLALQGLQIASDLVRELLAQRGMTAEQLQNGALAENEQTRASIQTFLASLPPA